jgi:hypothetical protein
VAARRGAAGAVTIPSVEREQLRDLVRCREDIRADLYPVSFASMILGRPDRILSMSDRRSPAGRSDIDVARL